MSNVEAKIKHYISTEFFSGEEETLLNDTPLLSSGIINSISVLRLVEFLENEFGFEFAPHEVDNDYLDTIDRISEFVNSKID